MKYKKGDKVKILESARSYGIPAIDLMIGKIYEIKKINNDNDYIINSWNFGDSNVELVPEKPTDNKMKTYKFKEEIPSDEVLYIRKAVQYFQDAGKGKVEKIQSIFRKIEVIEVDERREKIREILEDEINLFLQIGYSNDEDLKRITDQIIETLTK